MDGVDRGGRADQSATLLRLRVVSRTPASPTASRAAIPAPTPNHVQSVSLPLEVAGSEMVPGYRVRAESPVKPSGSGAETRVSGESPVSPSDA